MGEVFPIFYSILNGRLKYETECVVTLLENKFTQNFEKVIKIDRTLEIWNFVVNLLRNARLICKIECITIHIGW